MRRNLQFLKLFPTMNKIGNFSTEIVATNPTALDPTQRQKCNRIKANPFIHHIYEIFRFTIF